MLTSLWEKPKLRGRKALIGRIIFKNSLESFVSLAYSRTETNQNVFFYFTNQNLR